MQYQLKLDKPIIVHKYKVFQSIRVTDPIYHIYIRLNDVGLVNEAIISTYNGIEFIVYDKDTSFRHDSEILKRISCIC